MQSVVLGYGSSGKRSHVVYVILSCSEYVGAQKNQPSNDSGCSRQFRGLMGICYFVCLAPLTSTGELLHTKSKSFTWNCQSQFTALPGHAYPHTLLPPSWDYNWYSDGHIRQTELIRALRSIYIQYYCVGLIFIERICCFC